MILVVGGLASGKRTFAESLGFSADDMAFDVHELVRDVESADGVVAAASQKAVVTCAEVGSGIVPLDPGERAYRERVGRMCVALAERADAVVRMVCGVPVALKGEVRFTTGCPPARYSGPGEGGSPTESCPPARGSGPGGGGSPTAARQMFCEYSNLMPAQAAHPLPRGQSPAQATPTATVGRPPARDPGSDGGGSPTAARQMFYEYSNLMPAQAAHPLHRSRDPEQAACSVELILIRHGKTPGNEEGRYVGVVDQPLSEEGRAQARVAGVYGDVGRVYVSTLRRTRETASIMFPNAEQVVVEGIQEMDFGAFAGRTPDEMADDPQYRAWVDGMCLGTCPGGESQAELTDRVCAAMESLLREAAARGEERLVMVVHGGTMMGFLDRFGNDPSKRYWDWLVGNCEGYRIGVSCDEAGLVVHSIERW